MEEAGSAAMEELAGAGEENLQERPLYPAGICFRPTDEELVQNYLIPKTEDRPLPFPVPTLDVYGTEPSRLPMDLTYSVGGEIYCFARRTRRTENGTRAKRTVRAPAGEAMSGTWHASSKPQDISIGGKVVAVKRLLSFHPSGGGSRRNNSDGGWVMHEYCLKDSTKFQDLVLCMIRNRNAGKEEEKPSQLRSLSPGKTALRAAANTSAHAEGSHAPQQAPKGTAASDAGGEGALTAAPRASGSTVHLMAACGAPTAPVRRGNSAVDPDDLRISVQLSRLQMLRHSVHSPGPQAPPAPEHGNWPGSCPLPSPVPAATAVPACGQRPAWPNTPAFCRPLRTLRLMPIDELPPATSPEQDLPSRTSVCSCCLKLHPWGLPSSSATRMQDPPYYVFIEGAQGVGERRDDAGEGDVSASESVDTSGGREEEPAGLEIKLTMHHSDYKTKSCD